MCHIINEVTHLNRVIDYFDQRHVYVGNKKQGNTLDRNSILQLRG